MLSLIDGAPRDRLTTGNERSAYASSRWSMPTDRWSLRAWAHQIFRRRSGGKILVDSADAKESRSSKSQECIRGHFLIALPVEYIVVPDDQADS